MLCLVDLRKCFDVINHDILISKLRLYGIETSWFAAYLQGHTQSVSLYDGSSRQVLSGPLHSVAECQFSAYLIIPFDRNKMQTSNLHHFVSLVKAIRMTYNKTLTDQVMTLIRGIFKFATSLYDLK